MEESNRNHNAVFNLIQRYNSGQSLNVADGQYVHIENELPGAIIFSSSTADDEMFRLKLLQDEKERQRQRESALLEKQRQANLQEQHGFVREKIDYSIMQSEVKLDMAQKSTSLIAAAISKCSKLVLELDGNATAAADMPCINDENSEDFQSSIQQLFKCAKLFFNAARSFCLTCVFLTYCM
jgi:hypothetical protein